MLRHPWQPADDRFVAYGDPLARWTVAAQLFVELDDCTFVSLDAELERIRPTPSR